MLNEDQIAERGARVARPDDREYREYWREEQRSQPGCPAREMVLDQLDGPLVVIRCLRTIDGVLSDPARLPLRANRDGRCPYRRLIRRVLDGDRDRIGT